MYFAEIENGIVKRVIVADQKFIDSGVVGDPKNWVETSYDTKSGINEKGSPLRKNYAGVGYTYDADLDAFIPPKPHDSWVVDSDSGYWKSPITKPADGKNYEWSESVGWAETINNFKPDGNS